jgi:hypothetical protein
VARDCGWCLAGTAVRKRKAGTAVVRDPDAEAKKVTEAACTQSGIPVWTEDEAGH